MSGTAPGPIAELIEHAARIIVASKRQPHTAPYHWAGALWRAGMLVPPGTAESTERADLPEGQQPKSGTDPRSEAGRRQSAIRTLISQRDQAIDDLEAMRAEVERLRADHGKLTATIAAFPDAHNAANLAHARMERDALRAEVARVRADVAEEVATRLELMQIAQEELMQRRQGGQARECAIRARAFRAATDIIREAFGAPAESVVGAPTPYAEGFAEAVRRLRDDDRYAAAPEHLRRWNADVRYSLAAYLESDAPVGALPVDKGTRQEVRGA